MKRRDSPLVNGTHKGTQRNSNSIFNNYFCDAIRGNNNPNNIGNVIEGLHGSIYNLTAMPSESINYIDTHDNYTLWDQVKKIKVMIFPMDIIVKTCMKIFLNIIF